MKDRRTLRIGLLIDALVVSKYVRDIISWTQSQEHIALSCIIVNNRIPGHGLHNLTRLSNAQLILSSPSRLIFNIVIWCEYLLIRNSVSSCDHFAAYDV